MTKEIIDQAEEMIALLGDCIISARLLHLVIKDTERAAECARWTLQAQTPTARSKATDLSFDEHIRLLVDHFFLYELAKKRSMKANFFHKAVKYWDSEHKNSAPLSAEALAGLAYMRVEMAVPAAFDVVLADSESVAKYCTIKDGAVSLDAEKKHKILQLLRLEGNGVSDFFFGTLGGQS